MVQPDSGSIPHASDGWLWHLHPLRQRKRQRLLDGTILPTAKTSHSAVGRASDSVKFAGESEKKSSELVRGPISDTLSQLYRMTRPREFPTRGKGRTGYNDQIRYPLPKSSQGRFTWPRVENLTPRISQACRSRPTDRKRPASSIFRSPRAH